MRISILVTISALLFTSCSKDNRLLVSLDQKQTGVQFSNNLKNSAELNILNYLYYYNGSGVVAGDFNNDNLTDLFFTGNQVSDEIYINKGNLQFEKVKGISAMETTSGWSTGATHVDINNDGLLDLYVCKASGYKQLTGKNQLFINQGVDSDGHPTFKEEAEHYGLDFTGLSTHAAFLDYDKDGDLDMYLLNHSVHPNRNYGYGKLREGYDPLYGDVLFENDNGRFKDVSKEAGIFQGRIGYGLGLSIGDINNDGYPDIYVGNDFFENDYLYLNQKNGTFVEVISQNENQLGHTSHFSMGNTIADLNNDGLQDILSLDMLPENLETYKSSGLEYGYPIYRQYLMKGYAPQYMQNTFHLNLDGERFSEIGQLSGISATEWSWGVLAADLDNDGLKDIFVTNGIVGATNDMDYMNFIANENIQRRIDNGLEQNDLPLIEEIPEKKVPNYIFKNTGNLKFEDVSTNWMEPLPTFSSGSIFADLDNDGDLDLVVNNTNAPVGIFENTSNGSNFIKLKFKGPKANSVGIGVKVELYGTTKQVQENYPTKGYLSAVAPQLHFGLGKDSILDSIKVTWPDGRIHRLKNTKSNQTITINYVDAKSIKRFGPAKGTLYTTIDSIIPFSHKENISLDFDREPLIPFAGSNDGPCFALGDVNHDEYEDIFVGGAKKQASQLYLQQPDGSFNATQKELFQRFNLAEATASLFFDANGDGWEDLVVGYGGNEFEKGTNVRPRLFINRNGKLETSNAFDTLIEGNISAIEAADFDNDGDLDLALACNQTPGAFGQTPKSFILFNNGNGVFDDVTARFAPDFEFLGNLKDIRAVDLNSDGKKDLIAAGYWTPISIFINQGDSLTPQTKNGLERTAGWWSSLEIKDFDNDGDLDIISGNWGLNSKFSASVNKPITLYRNDFDGNGTTEPLVTYFHGSVETPFASKDALVKQLPFLNKEFLSYSKFASATLEELFGKDKLNNSQIKKVYELETSYFENLGNSTFQKKAIPLLSQISQTRKMICDDLDGDGDLDVILMGNNHHISTQLGRLDALHGLILYNDGRGNFIQNPTHLKVDGQVNDIKKLKIKHTEGYLIGRNDDSPVFLIKKDSL